MQWKNKIVILLCLLVLFGCEKTRVFEQNKGKYVPKGTAGTSASGDASSAISAAQLSAQADSEIESLLSASAKEFSGEAQNLPEDKLTFLNARLYASDLKINEDRKGIQSKNELLKNIESDVLNCGTRELLPTCLGQSTGASFQKYRYARVFDLEDKKNLTEKKIKEYSFTIDENRLGHIALVDIITQQGVVYGNLGEAEEKLVNPSDIEAEEEAEEREEAERTARQKPSVTRLIFFYELEKNNAKAVKLHLIQRPLSFTNIRQAELHHNVLLNYRLATVTFPVEQDSLKEDLLKSDETSYAKFLFLANSVLQEESQGISTKSVGEWTSIVDLQLPAKIGEAIARKDYTFLRDYLFLINKYFPQNNTAKQMITNQLIKSEKVQDQSAAAFALYSIGKANPETKKFVLSAISVKADKRELMMLFEALKDSSADTETENRIIGLLSHPDGDVRDKAEAYLKKIQITQKHRAALKSQTNSPFEFSARLARDLLKKPLTSSGSATTQSSARSGTHEDKPKASKIAALKPVDVATATAETVDNAGVASKGLPGIVVGKSSQSKTLPQQKEVVSVSGKALLKKQEQVVFSRSFPGTLSVNEKRKNIQDYVKFIKEVAKDMFTCGTQNLFPACMVESSGFTYSNYSYALAADVKDTDTIAKKNTLKYSFRLNEFQVAHATFTDVFSYKKNAEGNAALMKGKNGRQVFAKLIFLYVLDSRDNKNIHLHMIRRPEQLNQAQEVKQRADALIKHRLATFYFPIDQEKHQEELLKSNSTDYEKFYYLANNLLNHRNETLIKKNRAQWRTVIEPLIVSRIDKVIASKDKAFLRRYLLLTQRVWPNSKNINANLAKQLLISQDSYDRTLAALVLVHLDMADEATMKIALEGLQANGDAALIKIALQMFKKFKNIPGSIDMLIALLGHSDATVRAEARTHLPPASELSEAQRKALDRFQEDKFEHSGRDGNELLYGDAGSDRLDAYATNRAASPSRSRERDSLADERLEERNKVDNEGDLDTYLKLLGDADPKIRLENLLKAHMFSQDVVTKKIIDMLADGDTTVANEAENQLLGRELKEDMYGNIEKHIKQNKDKNLLKRAAFVLARIPGEKATSLFIELIVNPDPEISRVAGEAIADREISDAMVPSIEVAMAKGDVMAKNNLLALLDKIDSDRATVSILNALKEPDSQVRDEARSYADQRVVTDGMFEIVQELLNFEDIPETREQGLHFIAVYKNRGQMHTKMVEAVKARAAIEPAPSLKAAMDAFVENNQAVGI